MPAKPHLCLFFTKDVSLRTWDETGTFDREVAIYKWLQNKGVKVSFVTYGGKTDLAYADRLPGVSILCNRWELTTRRYIRWMPYLHAPHFAQVTTIKTNQSNGAEIALRVAQFWRKPLIARCGYMWSFNTREQYGADAPYTQHTLAIEQQVFSAANQIIVTTQRMADDIRDRIPEASAKTNIVPNFVDTNQFMPSDQAKCWDIIFIGRLSSEKNLENLLTAASNTNATILMIGKGQLGDSLRTQFSSLGDRITWIDRVPNSELPDYLNRSRVFVLPSLYEGHPKALIEAMSCGAAVIGSNTPGIREIIQHEHNGLLAETDSQSIQSAIERLLADSSLRHQLGLNARNYALEHYALDTIGQKEFQLIHEVAKK